VPLQPTTTEEAIEGLGIFSLNEGVFQQDIWFILQTGYWGVGCQKMDAADAKTVPKRTNVRTTVLRLALLEQLGGHDKYNGDTN
jgi:hypothetical protein